MAVRVEDGLASSVDGPAGRQVMHELRGNACTGNISPAGYLVPSIQLPVEEMAVQFSSRIPLL